MVTGRYAADELNNVLGRVTQLPENMRKDGSVIMESQKHRFLAKTIKDALRSTSPCPLRR